MVKSVLKKFLSIFGISDSAFLRYVAVSAINVVTHQVLLQLAYWFIGQDWSQWRGFAANTFATCVGTIPAYYLSRYWVWSTDDKTRQSRDIALFWGITLLGLLVSGGLAEAASRLYNNNILVSVASLIGFFIVWIAKFAVLNVAFADQTPEAKQDSTTPDAVN